MTPQLRRPPNVRRTIGGVVAGVGVGIGVGLSDADEVWGQAARAAAKFDTVTADGDLSPYTPDFIVKAGDGEIAGGLTKVSEP